MFSNNNNNAIYQASALDQACVSIIYSKIIFTTLQGKFYFKDEETGYSASKLHSQDRTWICPTSRPL